MARLNMQKTLSLRDDPCPANRKAAKVASVSKQPVKYSDKVFAEICEQIAQGRSLRSICTARNMPHVGTVMRWLADDQDGKRREQYARARDAQSDVIADEILMIADTEEDAQKARVRIDARKWLAGKMKPKVYGDKQTVEHQGGLSINLVDNFVTDNSE